MLLKKMFNADFLQVNWQVLLMILLSITITLASALILVRYNMSHPPLIRNDPISNPEDHIPGSAAPLEKLKQLTFFFRPQDRQTKDHAIAPSDPSDLNDRIFNAPLSNLDFHVTGVINASHQLHSLAIVRQNQKQYSLLIGERLPNTNAEIVHIFIDRVIINSGGKYESLRMDH